MSIERDVTIRLKVPKGREGDAFREAAKGAGKLQQETGRANKAVTGLISELKRSNAAEQQVSRITQQLTRMGVEANKAKQSAQQLMKQVGDAARVSTADVQRLGAALRQTGAAAGAGGAGGAGGARPLLGRLGSLAAPLAGAALVSGVGRTIANRSRTESDQAYFDQRAVALNETTYGAALQFGQDLMGSLPIIADVSRAADMSFSAEARRLFDVERRQAAEQESFQLNSSRARTRTAARRVTLGQDFQHRRAMLAGDQAATGVQGGIDQATFQERLRSEQMQRTLQQEVRAFQQGGTLAGPGSLAALRSAAGRAGSIDTTAADRMRIQRERESVQRQLSQVQQQINANLPTPAEPLQGGGTPDIAAAAMQRRVQLQQRLLELEQEQIGLVRQRDQARQQELETLRGQAAQQEEMFRSMAEAERQRVQSTRESFGEMDPQRRQQILNVSRAVAAGQPLNAEQQQIALANRQFFTQQSRQILNQRADAGGFQEIAQNLGFNQRVQSLQQRANEARDLRVQLENRISAEIRVNANDLAAAMGREIAPRIQALQAALTTQLSQQLQQALQQLQLNAGGGGGGP